MSAPVRKTKSIGYEEMDIDVGEDTSNLNLTNKLETHIMVVDDDSTTLALVAAMLKTWKYQVVAVRNAMDAISTLRISHTQFDLVVTDLHMPQMNGIELQRQVDEEFKIPVVIMSSNDKESVIMETLEGGAVFFLVKPVTRDDLKNVWQYSVSAKNKGKAAVVEEIGINANNNNIIGDGSSSSSSSSSSGGHHDEKISFKDTNNRDQGSSSSSSPPANGRKNSGGDKNKKKDTKNKGKSKKRSKEDSDDDDGRAPKKPKVLWTNSLHNRFLQAIRHIGLDRAVPKKILEFMAMPGLTRENVASHLQKYRLFLKRVAEQGNASCKKLTDRALRSSFANGHPWLMFNNLQHNYPQNNFNLQMRTTQFHPGLGFSSLPASSLGFTRYPYNLHGASTSNSAVSPPRLGYGHSSLLDSNNQPDFTQSLLGNHNLLNYQSVLASNCNNNIGTNFPSQAAGLSNALLAAAASSSSSGHIYQQQNQARPHLYTNTSPLFNFSESAGFGTPLQIQGSNSTGNTNNNNIGGIQVAGDGQLIGQGQIRFNDSNHQGGYGLMNGSSSNNNANVPPIQTYGGFGYLGQAAAMSSSGVFDSATNPIPPTFGNNASQQVSARELQPLPQQQQYHELNSNTGNDNNGGAAAEGGGEGFTSNLIVNNNGASNSPVDNIAHQLWGQHGGIGDLSDIFLEPTAKFEQQAGQSVQGADCMDGSLNTQLSPTFSELLNSVDLPSSYQVYDNDTWDEQLLGQIPGTELVNPNLGADPNPLDDCIPILEEQQNVSDDVMDSSDELSCIFQRGNINSGNQQSNDLDMEDDLDALLAGNVPF